MASEKFYIVTDSDRMQEAIDYIGGLLALASDARTNRITGVCPAQEKGWSALGFTLDVPEGKTVNMSAFGTRIAFKLDTIVQCYRA